MDRRRGQKKKTIASSVSCIDEAMRTMPVQIHRHRIRMKQQHTCSSPAAARDRRRSTGPPSPQPAPTASDLLAPLPHSHLLPPSHPPGRRRTRPTRSSPIRQRRLQFVDPMLLAVTTAPLRCYAQATQPWQRGSALLPPPARRPPPASLAARTAPHPAPLEPCGCPPAHDGRQPNHLPRSFLQIRPGKGSRRRLEC